MKILPNSWTEAFVKFAIFIVLVLVIFPIVFWCGVKTPAYNGALTGLIAGFLAGYVYDFCTTRNGEKNHAKKD